MIVTQFSFSRQIFAFLLLSGLCSTAYGRVHDFETTHLKSTAGAGVASFLMNEATVLNPAPLALFNQSALSLQKANAEFEPTSTENTRFFGEDDGIFSVIAGEAKGNVKGSVGYHKIREAADERKRYSMSFAKNAGKKSSLGVTYRYTKDQNFFDSRLIEDTYSQTIFGALHVLNENFSIGLVAVDPFRKRPIDSRVIVGAQYVYEDFFSLILDAGADYKDGMSETALVRGAIQIKAFQDFFLRAGVFSDKKLNEKGNGVGVGWVGPKLVLEAAQKMTKAEAPTQNPISLQGTIEELSFSLSYYF